MRFLLSLLIVLAVKAQPAGGDFRFAIVGDRTGTHQKGIFEAVWQQVAAWKPAFVVTIGDWIEGNNDATAEAEWRELEPVYRSTGLKTYFVAGNHDIWNRKSRLLYEQFTGRPAQYSFDSGRAHFTILDNSASLQLADSELDYLERDLQAHAGQQPKFVLFHQPGWLIQTMLGQTEFRLHQIAKKYGVTAVISGHTHMYKRIELEGITYLTVCSAGGAIRGRDPKAKGFEEGFFYGYTQVTVQRGVAEIRTQELGEPFGKARVLGVAYAEK